MRGDGTLVALKKSDSPTEEVKGLWIAVRQPVILLSLPMFFSSNYFCESCLHLTARQVADIR